MFTRACQVYWKFPCNFYKPFRCIRSLQPSSNVKKFWKGPSHVTYVLYLRDTLILTIMFKCFVFFAEVYEEPSDDSGSG